MITYFSIFSSERLRDLRETVKSHNVTSSCERDTIGESLPTHSYDFRGASRDVGDSLHTDCYDVKAVAQQRVEEGCINSSGSEQSVQCKAYLMDG